MDAACHVFSIESLHKKNKFISAIYHASTHLELIHSGDMCGLQAWRR